MDRRVYMPKLVFFQNLEGLTEVFDRMSARISGPKLPHWVDFSFLEKYRKTTPRPEILDSQILQPKYPQNTELAVFEDFFGTFWVSSVMWCELT